MKIAMDLIHTVLSLAAVVCSANAFSKYGRTCKDIGCLPSETCMIASDSCSWSQTEGKECGSYPTCKKTSTMNNNSPGASLNPGPDNTRVNHKQQPNNHGNSYNNYNPGSYNPSNPYSGHAIDPNQIFGNPNRQPQANQPWNNLPIFPPNPTSGRASPQQPIYPQAPQNYPSNPKNPQVVPNGLNPHQVPFAFGFPPPGTQQHNIFPPRPTKKQPSLLEQFLYNKQGGRRNAGATFDFSWKRSSFIFILSICNVLLGFILTNARH